MLPVEPSAWGRAPPTSALTGWLAAHYHRDHGTAPDILTLKPRPVGGPYHRHLGPHYSGCPILRSLAPSQALAQDERLRGRPGSEAGVEGHKAELAPGHGDLQAQLGSVGNLGSWTPIEEAKTYAESPLPAPPPTTWGQGVRLQAGLAQQRPWVPPALALL